jgi:RNA polymerase sigma-70 factor (ECF subfamily)
MKSPSHSGDLPYDGLVLETRQAGDGTITSLIVQARAGDKLASDQLFRTVYDELRLLARTAIAVSGAKRTIEGTALVHSACERLLEREQLTAENRSHFFFLLSRAMHDVLVDELRKAGAAKRGGDWQRVPFAEFAIPDASKTIEFLDLHRAIEDLRGVDHDCAEIVTLRFFGGRSIEEAATCLGCSVSAAKRHWTYARAWLFNRLSR